MGQRFGTGMGRLTRGDFERKIKGQSINYISINVSYISQITGALLAIQDIAMRMIRSTSKEQNFMTWMRDSRRPRLLC